MGTKYQFYPESGFVSFTPSGFNEDAFYPATNMSNYLHPKVQYRSSDTSSVNGTLTFSGANNILAVALFDTNFTSATIGGQAFTLSKSRANNRYQGIKVYAFGSVSTVSIAFSGTPTDGLSYFRIGTILCLKTCNEFVLKNPDYPYRYKGKYPDPIVNPFAAGAEERIRRSASPYKQFQTSFGFRTAPIAQAAELLDLDNAIDPVNVFVYYENMGDTSQAYLCRRDGEIEIEEQNNRVITGGMFSIKEVI